MSRTITDKLQELRDIHVALCASIGEESKVLYPCFMSKRDEILRLQADIYRCSCSIAESYRHLVNAMHLFAEAQKMYVSVMRPRPLRFRTCIEPNGSNRTRKSGKLSRLQRRNKRQNKGRIRKRR